MGSLPGHGCIRVVRCCRRSVKKLHRNPIAVVSVALLPNGLRAVRPAHGRFRNHRVCLGSVASEMAFPSARLFLVLSFNPRPNAALCIDRIGLGSEAKDIITLRSCVWPEHLVSRVDDSGGRGVVAAADLATQALAQ